MRFFWLLLVALGLGTKRHWHILFAIVLGLGLGLFFSGEQYAFLHHFFELIGVAFIRLITMLVIPLMISSLIIGVTSLGSGQQLGRMGGKVLVWFILLMVLASVVGVGLAWFFEPGTSLRHEMLQGTSHLANLTRSAAMLAPIEEIQKPPGLMELLFNLIPKNPVESLARMELVPVILFTLAFGVAIAWIGDAGKPLVQLFEAVFAATMKLTDWVMILAVPGVFSLTFVAVAQAGTQIFVEMAPFAMVLMMGLLLQVVVICPLILKFVARISPFRLYQAVSEAIMVGFGTASSSATLPVTIACCERRAGISNRIASFVLPTGAIINKTGTTLFEVLAVTFLAQAYGIPLELNTVVLIMVFAIIASIGAPGVPSAGLITMAIVINSLGPQYTPLFGGIAMLWPLDRLLDMCRTSVNIISSCTVAAVVASNEGELNRDVLNQQEKWTEVV